MVSQFYQDFFQSIQLLWNQHALGVFQWGDIVVFITIFISELGVPIFNIPNEAVLIFGGSQFGSTIGVNELRFILAAVTADVLGATIFYFIFRSWGHWILERFGPRIGLTHAKLQRFYDYFARSGFWASAIGRITPYLRIYTSMAAGLFLVKPNVFLSAVIPSSIIWVTVFSLVGFTLRKKWQTGVHFFEEHQLTILTMIFLVALITFLRWRNNGKNKEFHEPRPAPAESIQTTDNVTISYLYEKGNPDLPTIIFLHGVAGNHTCWYDIAPHFSKRGYGVLLPDLRGHGLSSKIQKRWLYHLPRFLDDLELLVQKEKLTNIILVGYSIGGAIATLFAKRHPLVVKKVVLISTNHTNPLTYRGIGFLLPIAQVILDILAVFLHWYRRRRYAFFSQLEIKPLWKSTLETLKTIPLDINLWSIRTAISVHLHEKLKLLPMPVLVLRGYHDHLLTLREAEDMLTVLPNGELKVVANANHFLPTHHPEKIVKPLEEFILRR
ncbi:hypothetical protein A2841_02040 [Candidatus Kaiserbacteria bacterium RIFCSPHIGHO2_01_FULL_48_10]|uniref:Uncharacterized protein n=1 Tax=Candidatus Kaiserbacteria bacterium RIFCSPHIGHO2_01_FULL_48_10 TaxID=1798476 RepID=A0A1F6C6I7_9BACT|nr:MAG: hypothetical protein A2841_02040 [Candidatus Kaiserbacteria bacterium RIFCSPHIGHO2_01_FULL_48_10]HLD00039.1 alpha/beta fold hydrolase [Patescibacteria group bacterium]